MVERRSAEPLHPHVVRHCFATRLLHGVADLWVVEELLGHADVVTTTVYSLFSQQAAVPVVTGLKVGAR